MASLLQGSSVVHKLDHMHVLLHSALKFIFIAAHHPTVVHPENEEGE